MTTPAVLFVHNGAPGRFDFIATSLAKRGWRGALINGPDGRDLTAFPTSHWRLVRGSTSGIFDPAIRVEADLLRGRAAAETALPVRDVIQPGVNGLLTDFFDHEALADTLIAVCRDNARYQRLRKMARETIVTTHNRATICEPAWKGLVEEVAGSTRL